VDDPPTSTAIPAAAARCRARHLAQHLIVLARHIGRQGRQPWRRILRMHRPVHLQHERVGHLLQRPPRYRHVTVRPGQRLPDLFGQPGEHSFDPMSLQAS
jgi:hypothetical protein